MIDSPEKNSDRRIPRVLLAVLALLAVWAVLMTGAITTVMIISGKPYERAVLYMAVLLFVVWVMIGGTLQYAFRHRIRALVARSPFGWQTTFILFCTVLALLEEAVTTTLTNCAPLFGVAVGEAYITASANYLDVVLFHSVVVFVPMFVMWAWILTRYEVRPAVVLLLFGCTGVLAEAGSFGLQNLLNAGFWVYVYGLMVALPVFCIPRDRVTRKPRWWHYPLFVVLPFIAAIPVAVVVNLLHPVSIHFPPIGGQ